ncbi:hypothetical protein QR680_014033 [Steinernema hermaphroditum]|uniref:Uncharacterized protein n=1 Tax=Steinernema hermaphroditum TaxID=289476 RepID=A0AA39M3D0_9BILA|nr:hypothetical protein QR680_014033 [Steinernema hermaphroditum]
MSALVQFVCLSVVAVLQVSAAIRVSRSWIDLTPIPHFPSPPHSDHVLRSLFHDRNEKLNREGSLERTLVGSYFNMMGKYGTKPAVTALPAAMMEAVRRPPPGRVIIRDLTSNKIRTAKDNPYGTSKSAKALCGMMKLC